MTADVTRAIERQSARHSAAEGEAGRRKSIRTRHRRAATALAAIALTLLVGGCVCRPLHVSGTAPATVEDIKASLP